MLSHHLAHEVIDEVSRGGGCGGRGLPEASLHTGQKSGSQTHK